MQIYRELDGCTEAKESRRDRQTDRQTDSEQHTYIGGSACVVAHISQESVSWWFRCAGGEHRACRPCSHMCVHVHVVHQQIRRKRRERRRWTEKEEEEEGGGGGSSDPDKRSAAAGGLRRWLAGFDSSSES